MEIQQQTIGAVTVLRPRGPATQESAAGLSSALMDARTKSLGRVVLDVSVVPFVDSVVLEHLLDVTEDLAKTGQALKLSGANDVVREVLELTDIASRFELFEDVNSAVRSFL